MFFMVVIIVFGFTALLNAGRFAWAPGPSRLPYLLALGAAIFFAGIAGTAADLMAVSIKVPANPEWANSPDLPLILLMGIGESLAPTVLSMGLLIAHSLLIALGLRRLVG